MKITSLPASPTTKNGRGVIGKIPFTLLGFSIALPLFLTGLKESKVCCLYSNIMLSNLSLIEPVHALMLSGTWINILCGILAVVCYGLFSKFYEPLTRSTESSLITACLLYAGSASLLFIASAITALICGFVLGWHFAFPSSVRVFGLHFSIMWVVVFALGVLILAMSLLYFLHIVTEAFARRGINMGIYTILFQLNVLVISGIDWAIYHTSFSFYMVVGGVLIFLSSTGALIIHHFASRAGNTAVKLDRIVMILGMISALACGLALYIDGEVGRNYIFQGPFKFDALALFLLYEMLTFGIPSLWTLLVLFCIRQMRLKRVYGNHDTLEELDAVKVLMPVQLQLRKEFERDKKNYVLSSLFSAGQFVFSVLALSLPGQRYYVAAALAMSPLFSLLLDRNEHPRLTKWFEYGCGIASALGLFLLLLGSR